MPLHAELAIRIVVGTLLGSVIGYERDVHGRPAGLRTHALVALASTTFMVVSTKFVYFQHYASGDLVAVDSSRIAASVVSGIGFLAGGAILRTGLTIQGLTTAAGLWLVAAIGLAAGGGMYVESVLVTAVGLLALTQLRRFEDKDDRVARRYLTITIPKDGLSVGEIAERVKALGAQVTTRSVTVEEGTQTAVFEVRSSVGVSIDRILAELGGKVSRAHLELA